VPTRDTQKKVTYETPIKKPPRMRWLLLWGTVQYVTRWQRWTVAGLQGIWINGLGGDPGLAFTEPYQPDQRRAE
jgi:hypothetical protein